MADIIEVPGHVLRLTCGAWYVYTEGYQRYIGSRKTEDEARALAAQAQENPPPPRQWDMEPAIPPEEETDMAKRKAKAKAAKVANGNGEAKRGRPARTEGEPTLKQLTEQYNALVPRAEKKGLKGVKVHTSAFGSRDGAVRQIAKLREQLGLSPQ